MNDDQDHGHRFFLSVAENAAGDGMRPFIIVIDDAAGTEEGLTLQELQSKIVEDQLTHHTHLLIGSSTLGVNLRNLNDDNWKRFCEMIPATFPNLSDFSLNAFCLHDHQIACLLDHMPANLTKLTLAGLGDLPLALEKIGRFTQLEVLGIVGGSRFTGEGMPCLTVEGCKILSKTLNQLSRLNTVTFEALHMHKPHDCWALLSKAIKGLPNLDHVHVYPGYEALETRWENGQLVTKKVAPFCLASDVVDSLKFRPLVREAERKYLTGDTVTLKQWVAAIISVQGRVDCLDFFVSKVDPNLFAPTAIANLKRKSQRQGMAGSKRKIDCGLLRDTQTPKETVGGLQKGEDELKTRSESERVRECECLVCQRP